MISHITFGTHDYPRAAAFYDAVTAPLGLKQKFAFPEHGAAAWGPVNADRPLLFVMKPNDGNAPSSGNGQMTAIMAPSRAAVDAAHKAALKQGGTCEGPPGLRAYYHPNFYGAYFRDPDGNKLCVVCHDPVP